MLLLLKTSVYATAICVLFVHECLSDDFNIGIGQTSCNLDPSKGTVSDPCKSLYKAVCDGKHCACPKDSRVDPNLKVCVRGQKPKAVGGSSAAGDDLGFPFDYVPNKKPGQPATPKPSDNVNKPASGNNPSQPNYNPNQPAYNPNQPGYNPNQPSQPGYNPNQPGYNPNQPGYNPNQPGYNPNQPGYNPNQPGNNPNQPGYNPNQPGNNPNQHGGGTIHPKKPGKGGKDGVGEEVGGGVGGLISLLIIGGLIYFCCCRKGKSKDIMGKFQGLPFMKGRGAPSAAPGPAAGAYQMQAGATQQHDPNFSSQHTYIPPDQDGVMPPPGMPPQGMPPQGPTYPPPGQPYPGPGQPYPGPGQPYPGPGQPYPPPGENPPPYTPQYQANAPPPQ